MDEVKGSGNSWDYKYRMHDARLGRFFAVDPLYGSYPWNSTYAFSENRVIVCVELEGLEAVDAQTGKVNNNLVADNLESIKSQKNTAPWSDLSSFGATVGQIAAANLRGNDISGQSMSHAAGDVISYDYYSLTFCPDGTNFNEKNFFNDFRVKLDKFIVGSQTEEFGPSSVREGVKWKSSDPLTTVMRFEVHSGIAWFREGMAVLTTQFNESEDSRSWIFTPVTSQSNGDFGHPLAGNRQFGLTHNNDGTYTLFTRGVDTPWTWLDNKKSADIFKGAADLWSTVMGNAQLSLTKMGVTDIKRSSVQFTETRK